MLWLEFYTRFYREPNATVRVAAQAKADALIGRLLTTLLKALRVAGGWPGCCAGEASAPRFAVGLPEIFTYASTFN